MNTAKPQKSICGEREQAMRLTIEKYHGLGNDYLVYDPNKNKLALTPSRVQLLCNRNFGVGADGILEGPVMENDRISMVIWNSDGSRTENSGNGVSIFAKYLKDAGYVQKRNFHFQTPGGEIEVFYLNEDGSRIRLSVGKASFWSDEIPVTGERREVVDEDMVFGRNLYPTTCVSVGNPHCVIPMKEVSKHLVCKIGNHSEIARYFPNKINTQVMQVIDEENIRIEIFERGVGYTLASGSSACAAAAAAYKLGLTNPGVTVHMPGGELQVEIQEDWEIFVTGEVFYIGKMILGNELSEKLRMM